MFLLLLLLAWLGLACLVLACLVLSFLVLSCLVIVIAAVVVVVVVAALGLFQTVDCQTLNLAGLPSNLAKPQKYDSVRLGRLDLSDSGSLPKKALPK